MQYKGYLIDLDGTIYVGKTRLHEAEAFVKRLQKANIPFLFVTNNSTKTPEMVAKVLKEQCELDVLDEQIYTSALAAIDYIKKNQLGQRLFVIGSSHFKQLCEDNGFILDEHHPDIVLQGLDNKITYDILKRASLAIQKGATYMVTNEDHQMPTEEGFVPGSGAIMSFLTTATKIKPIVIGKPNKAIMDGAIQKLKLLPHEVIMVGDNYNTDILAGINYPMPTLLALTGVTKKEDLLTYNKDHLPTHIVDNLSQWQI